MCPELTVAEVRRALAAGAAAIITEKGDFASHAANLLRSARARGAPIIWIRGIVVAKATHVVIRADGTCEFDPLAEVRVSATRIAAPGIFRFGRARDAWDAVCLWPDRRYAEDEFLLAKPGLEYGASELAGASIEANLWRGRVWFDAPALANDELLDFALDEERSVPYLERMVDDYSRVIRRLQLGDNSIEIPFLFFSTLLPFHKSYGRVIRQILEAGTPLARVAEDVVLTNGVVEWLDGRGEFSGSTKIAGDPLWKGLFPPDTISAYVSDAEQRVMHAVSLLPSDLAHWAALVAVVKEFKMVIAKNLYAGFLAGTSPADPT